MNGARGDAVDADLLLRLRVATEADALCVGVLATQVFLDTYATQGIRPSLAREVLEQLSTPAVVEMLAAPGARFILAEQAGHLIAFVQVRIGSEHELARMARPAEIVRLYVLERFTGRGLGKKLLLQAEALAASENSTHTWLTAWVGNSRALTFYARCGYSERGSSTYTFEGEHYENRVFLKDLTGGDVS